MPNMRDRLEKNKLPNIPMITTPSTFAFLNPSATKQQSKMMAKHPADLKRYFCLLRWVTLPLLHFGQCILFICDTVYPKIQKTSVVSKSRSFMTNLTKSELRPPTSLPVSAGGDYHAEPSNHHQTGGGNRGRYSWYVF